MSKSAEQPRKQHANLKTAEKPSKQRPESPSPSVIRWEYAEFEKKVKRTIYIDNLSPQVTPQVITAALDQCATVKNVEFIRNYTIPYDIPSAALVEMENEQHATAAVNMMRDFPFMMSGMPRPVRARPAIASMFHDRPTRPGRKPAITWVEPKDHEKVKKMKEDVRKKESESMALVKFHLQEEENLAKHQQELLDANLKKYDMVQGVIQDGSMYRLARCYGIRIDD